MASGGVGFGLGLSNNHREETFKYLMVNLNVLTVKCWKFVSKKIFFLDRIKLSYVLGSAGFNNGYFSFAWDLPGKENISFTVATLVIKQNLAKNATI